MFDTSYLEAVVDDLSKQVQAIDKDLTHNKLYYKTAKLEKTVRLTEKRNLLKRQATLIDEINQAMWYHPYDTEDCGDE